MEGRIRKMAGATEWEEGWAGSELAKHGQKAKRDVPVTHPSRNRDRDRVDGGSVGGWMPSPLFPFSTWVYVIYTFSCLMQPSLSLSICLLPMLKFLMPCMYLYTAYSVWACTSVCHVSHLSLCSYSHFSHPIPLYLSLTLFPISLFSHIFLLPRRAHALCLSPAASAATTTCSLLSPLTSPSLPSCARTAPSFVKNCHQCVLVHSLYFVHGNCGGV